MKNRILLLIVVILSVFAVSSFKEEEISLEEENDTLLAIKDSKSGIIKMIDLEEYVLGVVAGEMPASFNEEALKAQAIAARSYALYKMNNSKNDYDLVTDITNQVYITNEEMKDMWQSGYQKYYKKVKDAVYDTKGLVMTYDGDIILSMYFSTSNGYTEDAKEVFGVDTPYLKSVASFENTNPRTVSFTKNEFCGKLNISCNELKINNIIKNGSGRVSYVIINDKEYKGVELRSLLGLRSTDFVIDVNNTVDITTSGYGHGVGMSQYGAENLAKSGKTYEEILKFYYQNINIEKINV